MAQFFAGVFVVVVVVEDLNIHCDFDHQTFLLMRLPTVVTNVSNQYQYCYSHVSSSTSVKEKSFKYSQVSVIIPNQLMNNFNPYICLKVPPVSHIFDERLHKQS